MWFYTPVQLSKMYIGESWENVGDAVLVTPISGTPSGTQSVYNNLLENKGILVVTSKII